MLIETLFDDVRVRIPLAPVPLVEMAARRALAEFFKKSTAWRERNQGMAITAAKHTYEIVASAPIVATTDLRVLETQQPIYLRTEQQLQDMAPGWKLTTGAAPWYAMQESPSTLRLYPIPDTTANHLDIQVALYPDENTADIPDWIGSMYRDPLVDGICGVLFEMDDQKWANPKAADRLLTEMRAAARSARIRVEKSNTRAPETARFTSWDDL